MHLSIVNQTNDNAFKHRIKANMLKCQQIPTTDQPLPMFLHAITSQYFLKALAYTMSGLVITDAIKHQNIF